MRGGPSREAVNGAWPIAIALIVLAGVVLIPTPRHWVQRQLGSNRPMVLTFRPLGVGPGFQAGRPYPPNDQWAAFLPAPGACPGSTSRPSNSAVAEQAMVCVLNY